MAEMEFILKLKKLKIRKRFKVLKIFTFQSSAYAALVERSVMEQII